MIEYVYAYTFLSSKTVGDYSQHMQLLICFSKPNIGYSQVVVSRLYD